MKRRLGSVVIVILAVICIVFLIKIFNSHAGCGCEKPIPPPAQLIPNVGYPGAYVRIFDKAFIEGQEYEVGIEHMEGKPLVVCKMNRDGLLMLKVKISDTIDHVGPAKIEVKDEHDDKILEIPKERFTLAPKAIPIPNEAGTYYVKKYRAAVDNNGVVYVALDMSEVRDSVTIVGTFLNYPLWLEPEDVIIFNSQGFTMTELANYELPISVPGMDVVYEWKHPKRSDSLIYWRHEFNTYFLQHDERECYFTDPENPDYHLDGTRHIDHNQLIFAIAGLEEGEKIPESGEINDLEFSIGIFFNNVEAFDFVDRNEKEYDMILEYEEYVEEGDEKSWRSTQPGDIVDD